MPRPARLVLGSLALLFLALAAVAALAGPQPGVDAPPTPITSLEAGTVPPEEGVRVHDGLLVWSRAVVHGGQALRTEAFTVEGYYVPLVSEPRALETAREDGPLAHVRALVHIHPEVAERDFPWLAAGGPVPAPSRHEVFGAAKPGRTIEYGVKQEIAGLFPGLDPTRVVVIDHDAPDETLFALLGCSLLALLVLAWMLGGRKPERDSLEQDGPVMDVVVGERVRHDTHAARPEAVRQA